MKKVVVKVRTYSPNISYSSGVQVDEDLQFEGKKLTVFNNVDGLLIVKDLNDNEQLAVFNKGEWIYWSKIA